MVGPARSRCRPHPNVPSPCTPRVNETSEDVVDLEIGDRTAGHVGSDPDDDLVATLESGRWRFRRRDGAPY